MFNMLKERMRINFTTENITDKGNIIGKSSISQIREIQLMEHRVIVMWRMGNTQLESHEPKKFSLNSFNLMAVYS